MKPLYEHFEDDLEIFHMNTRHVPPHIHGLMEIAHVTDGTLEVGVGEDFFHMETGDLAIIFPDVIHHYQVFGEGQNRALFLIVSPTYCEAFKDLLAEKLPISPVIPGRLLHPDVGRALAAMTDTMTDQKNEDRYRHVSDSPVPYAEILLRAYIQIILARSVPLLSFKDKKLSDSKDLVYQVISYISARSTEAISLTSMARDLLVTPNALSKVFSGTFHTNFNTYLNNVRLEHAASLLKYTDMTIAEVLDAAGFESQRTFDRVFADKYRMSPREYRRQFKNPQSMESSLHRVGVIRAACPDQTI